ncbi:hypothetical protein GCM10027416_14640 [Okibacterium endophyticum]
MVDDLVAGRGEMFFKVPAELQPGVIGADVNAHCSILPVPSCLSVTFPDRGGRRNAPPRPERSQRGGVLRIIGEETAFNRVETAFNRTAGRPSCCA